MIIGGILGAQFITAIDPRTAQLVLGVFVLVYAVSQLVKIRIPTPSALSERIWTPIVGVLSGLLGGGRGRIFRATNDYVSPCA